jgi:hypothetical protein
MSSQQLFALEIHTEGGFQSTSSTLKYNKFIVNTEQLPLCQFVFTRTHITAHGGIFNVTALKFVLFNARRTVGI